MLDFIVHYCLPLVIKTNCMYFQKFFRSVGLALLLLLCCRQGFSQSRWEQLEPTLKDSSEKASINFYLAGAKALFLSNRKLSGSFAEKGYVMAQKSAAYQNELADLSNMLGLVFMYNEQYDKAESYLQKELDIARQVHNEALQQKALSNLALNSSRKGNYQKAILQNLELLPIVEKSGDLISIGNVYANMSNAHYYLGQLKQSETYQKRALISFTKAGYEPGMSNAYNTLGVLADDQKQYAVALGYIQKSLAIKQKIGDSSGIANAYVSLYNVYSSLKRPADALPALLKAEAIFKAMDEEMSLAKVYVNLGTYYADQKNYATAAKYQEIAINLAQKNKDPYILSTVYENLSSSYAHLKSMDTALSLSRKALASKDSLFSTTVQQQISEMAAKYETEKKERVIDQQEAELSRKQAELKERQLEVLRRNYALGGIGLLLVLLIIIGYLLYRRAKLKQKAKLQEAVYRQQQLNARAVLEAEEKERIRIAQDLHDGVGQMMSIAKMNLSSIESSWQLETGRKLELENVIGLVDESCREVRAISHNLMPNALLKAGLSAAVREFIDKINSSSLSIDLYVEGLDQRLDPATETVLYRVIQECVNNVIKHANATQLDISLLLDREGVSITVEDNGKGFSFEEKKNSNGLGLSNMATRVAYLKGTIEWDSTPGKGTLVAVHVPAMAS